MRYKKVLIHGKLFVDFCTAGFETHVKCVQGLPEGTRFAYAIPETAYGIWIIVEHESFPLLNDGELIPIADSGTENMIIFEDIR